MVGEWLIVGVPHAMSENGGLHPIKWLILVGKMMINGWNGMPNYLQVLQWYTANIGYVLFKQGYHE